MLLLWLVSFILYMKSTSVYIAPLLNYHPLVIRDTIYLRLYSPLHNTNSTYKNITQVRLFAFLQIKPRPLNLRGDNGEAVDCVKKFVLFVDSLRVGQFITYVLQIFEAHKVVAGV